MKCPDEVQECLLRILNVGVLNIRFYLGQPNYELSAIEANHIHNLPDLMLNFFARSIGVLFRC
jgi:hypothetical protein